MKFRIWIPRLKTMNYNGFLLGPEGKPYVISAGDFISGKRHLWDLDDIEPDKDYKLMQSSCRKDVDGREIYEGDIVSGMESYFDHKAEKWKELGEGSFHIWYFDLWAEWSASQNHPYSESGTSFKNIFKPKVIGNIYENPELLKNETH